MFLNGKYKTHLTFRIYWKMVKYQLEFTEFPRFCQELIGNLQGSDDFSDIALMGDDNRPFKAHKLVLRAHSNVIRDVLSSTGVAKPLLYLREGLKKKEKKVGNFP